MIKTPRITLGHTVVIFGQIHKITVLLDKSLPKMNLMCSLKIRFKKWSKNGRLFFLLKIFFVLKFFFSRKKIVFSSQKLLFFKENKFFFYSLYFLLFFFSKASFFWRKIDNNKGTSFISLLARYSDGHLLSYSC